MVRTFQPSHLGLGLAASLGLAVCTAPAPHRSTGAVPTTAESTAGPAPGAHAAGSPTTQRTHPDPASPPDPAREAPTPAKADSGYVQYDQATKTVTFRLVTGPFQFNGFSSGGATLTVPPGSNNIWNFEQADGTPHSAEIASGTGTPPNSGGDPAIPRAYTNKVVEGLPQGGKDVIRFTAPDSGTYRIICGVPGHALSGMWIWLKVDPAATEPAFGPTTKP
jgi:sulfocyanin SoxE-like protein